MATCFPYFISPLHGEIIPIAIYSTNCGAFHTFKQSILTVFCIHPGYEAKTPYYILPSLHIILHETTSYLSSSGRTGKKKHIGVGKGKGLGKSPYL